ncbi:glycine betaine ABC transporter substrate-binding protein [Corynebacterium sphenisci]|uniref:glycine betaine ABC transporter substrate-binding protein n=1 Tax=Corynebacterium sphenisci TaxID=191493 RepID=UPI0026E083FD|nr:glycine betaine ABC transporter substrate-binding protein [Corynebacterium sphenisci]MDO5731657.1 glycine betaine ABC transporter substrate-binding protein [Corynebacterium sphenisci]
MRWTRTPAGRGALAALAAATLAAAGCAPEPGPERPVAQSGAALVAQDPSVVEQRVLGEVYAGAFDRVGRAARTTPVALADRVAAVRAGTATVGFGCTGELLRLLDPATAAELHAEYAAVEDPDKGRDPGWRDRTYAAMSAALPGEVMATDPSNAIACGWLDGEGAGYLPQHLVPFYRKPALDRRQRVEVLNRVAGSISTGEVAELVAEVDAGAEPAAVARRWLGAGRFATG